ncbi:MAG: DNA cytosine methyltransferase, partial [Cyanobacteria bacterium P01_G01_bin.49]
MIKSSLPTAIDLFSGAGGTGLGFIQCGYNILGAVELDKYAAETYEKNLDIGVTQVDIRELEPKNFRETLNLKRGELDVLVGCPPCQGFSQMRVIDGSNHKDNDLVLIYLEFVKEFLPKFAVFENVPGLIKKLYGRVFFDKLCQSLQELGYTLVHQLVDVVDYGVAQHRKRV